MRSRYSALAKRKIGKQRCEVMAEYGFDSRSDRRVPVPELEVATAKISSMGVPSGALACLRRRQW
jgi:hypothetical protein